MDYEYIKLSTLKVFSECQIYSFPLDCFSILKHYNKETRSYSSLDSDLRIYCIGYSDDAFQYKDKICYNDNMPMGRIRFSLMHELGHIILHHDIKHSPEMEQEANFFASNILAPRMAVHYSGCKNQNDVANLFEITNEAAQYAFDDYRRWHKWTVFHKMNDYDKIMYSHFYNRDQNGFVYKINRCSYCDTLIYNSHEITCKKCRAPLHTYSATNHHTQDFMVAESQWLYGFE